MAHDVTVMFRSEHQAFTDLIAGLTTEQWMHPSLCKDWTIQDVVVHAAFHTHRSGLRETLGSTERATARLVQRAHAETTHGLIAWFASPPGASAIESKVNVCELVIHQQDVRRTLGCSRDYPHATLRMCLDHCTSVSGNILVVGRVRRLGRGLRLSATDLSWTSGNGPAVEGTGEALLMAIAGRPDALADLTGPGAPILAERCTRDLAPSVR